MSTLNKMFDFDKQTFQNIKLVSSIILIIIHLSNCYDYSSYLHDSFLHHLQGILYVGYFQCFVD
jgi:hypothetical protein